MTRVREWLPFSVLFLAMSASVIVGLLGHVNAAPVIAGLGIGTALLATAVIDRHTR